jgi:trehalose monomycolate/heme transporter
VFLVSRMVEARERGMSTAEAIRIGTATTGRLITAAALVLAVVAGSFVFSDLVMMKYLAFGLMAALLLDATVVRMFLVPSVMKLLGDDCWWAPRWARRLQNRIGLGEIDLPDEYRLPAFEGRALRRAVTAPSVAALSARPQHDPTHPGVSEPWPRVIGRPEIGPIQELPAAKQPPSGVGPPSGASTARMKARTSQPTEAKTTRLSAPGKGASAKAASSNPASSRGSQTPGSKPSGSKRRPSSSTPSSGQTRAMPIPGNSGDNSDPAEPTTALPAQRSESNDSEAATEKLNARGQGDKARQRRRIGGALSAQDLLRREGRL